ncbi:hypothetical protein ACNJHR_21185, partial [Mycobacterium tuberculosis]
EMPVEAIRRGVRVRLHYDGFSRTVEVHTVDMTHAGRQSMSVFQVSGGSATGDGYGWKLMSMDKSRGMSLTDSPSGAPRQGFQRGDKRMQRIIAEM